MIRHDWHEVWADHTPNDIASRMVKMAQRTGHSYAYVHGDRMLISDVEIEDYRDDLTAVADSGTAHRQVRDKLVEGFDASRGDR